MAGFLSKFLFGQKPKIQQTQDYNPQQQNFLNDLLQKAQSGNQDAFKYLMSILSDEEGVFEDFEKPAMDQFEQDIVPNILERLNRGGGMSKGGSYLNQTLGRAASGLSTNLAAQRAGLKQNAIEQLNRYGQMGLQKQTTPYIQGGQQGLFGMLAPAAGNLLGGGLQNLFNR